jgi:thiol:disulfide interchange protein
MAEPNNTQQQEPQQQAQQQTQQQQAQQAPTIDYNKIQQMLEGTLAAKEDTALKAYFKQQGLSQEDAETAMAEFKKQKAAQQPDVAKLQNDVQAAQGAALNAQIENKALLMHAELGIDLQTMPFVLKLADLKEVIVDGAINDEKLKEALNAVLENVPQFKKSQEQQTQGFHQIGAAQQQQTAGGGSTGQQTTVPAKRWNRFNR